MNFRPQRIASKGGVQLLFGEFLVAIALAAFGLVDGFLNMADSGNLELPAEFAWIAPLLPVAYSGVDALRRFVFDQPIMNSVGPQADRGNIDRPTSTDIRSRL